MTEQELVGHYSRLKKDWITAHVVKSRAFASRRRVVEMCKGKGPVSGRDMFRVSLIMFNEDGMSSKDDKISKVMFSLEKAELYYNETLDFVLALEEESQESQR